jgi:hypothetical protein
MYGELPELLPACGYESYTWCLPGRFLRSCFSQGVRAFIAVDSLVTRKPLYLYLVSSSSKVIQLSDYILHYLLTRLSPVRLRVRLHSSLIVCEYYNICRYLSPNPKRMASHDNDLCFRRDLLHHRCVRPGNDCTMRAWPRVERLQPLGY